MGTAVALDSGGGGSDNSKSSYRLLRAYYMPSILLSPLTLLSHLFHTTALQRRSSSHFRCEEIET